jgi:hypothetical protein
VELTVSTEAELDAALLHSLRIKGRATESALAAAIPAAIDDVEAALRRGLAEDWFVSRGGRLAGWLLTPAGREQWARQHEAERAGCDIAGLESLYDNDFLGLNGEFKAMCTRWQLVGDLASTTDELNRIHRDNLALLERFSVLLPRFAGFAARFDAALARFTGGDSKALLQPLTDSYHDIWLELHEDLLLLLEKQREEND